MTEFERFYHESIWLRPFDVPNNPVGFPFVDGPRAEDARTFPQRGVSSCQSALMPILRYFASKCHRITEFGCREGYSTAALGMGLVGKDGACLTSVDVRSWPVHEFFKSITLPFTWKMVYDNIVSGWFAIEETDMLHVDDLHCYEQVKKELALHGGKVKKILTFHDTYSQGTFSLDVAGAKGINPAIDEYTAANGWKEVLRIEYNHGLRVFEKEGAF